MVKGRWWWWWLLKYEVEFEGQLLCRPFEAEAAQFPPNLYDKTRLKLKIWHFIGQETSIPVNATPFNPKDGRKIPPALIMKHRECPKQVFSIDNVACPKITCASAPKTTNHVPILPEITP
jgi:hypothetical protein